jgi:hypothetical protein
MRAIAAISTAGQLLINGTNMKKSRARLHCRSTESPCVATSFAGLSPVSVSQTAGTSSACERLGIRSVCPVRAGEVDEIVAVRAFWLNKAQHRSTCSHVTREDSEPCKWLIPGG